MSKKLSKTWPQIDSSFKKNCKPLKTNKENFGKNYLDAGFVKPQDIQIMKLDFSLNFSHKTPQLI